MFVGQSIVKQYSHDNSCLSICRVWPWVKLFMSRKLFLPLVINSYPRKKLSITTRKNAIYVLTTMRSIA